MTKPSWDDAPEWAQYLAQDEGGEWYWFEYEPTPSDVLWVTGIDRYESAMKSNPDWRDTLEHRPEQENQT